MPEEQQPQQTEAEKSDVYAVYCGDMNAANSNKLVQNLTAASASGKIKTLHILWQSWGGFVGDGVFVYNLLHNFPMDIVLYNAGHVASAGVTAFLGAQKRKATKNSLFMIHEASQTCTSVGASKLKAAASSLDMENARTEGILRTHLRLPEEMWTQLGFHDVYLTGEMALQYGLVDEIAEFAPPPGSKVLN